jgi:hypothetical protein
VIRSVALAEMDKLAKPETVADLAVAPNGRNRVVAVGSLLLFMTTEGKVLKDRDLDDESAWVLEPTFSPDSRRVACKYLVDSGKKHRRTAAILFFSPEGKGLSTFEIPSPGATTRPDNAGDGEGQSRPRG